MSRNNTYSYPSSHRAATPSYSSSSYTPSSRAAAPSYAASSSQAATPSYPTGRSGSSQATRNAARPFLPELSEWSTPAVPLSLWSSTDILLGAGAVIIQPSTQCVCILEDLPRYPGYYFLPRGRKDVGESLEQTALREAYEESGYRAEFLPALHQNRQPRAPGTSSHSQDLTTEAFNISLRPYFNRSRKNSLYGGEHIVFWYLCQIPRDATVQQGTRMPDEQGFVTHLLPYEEALDKMYYCANELEYRVLEQGISWWRETVRVSQHPRP